MSRIFRIISNKKTRMFGLSDGEEIMTLTLFVLIQYRRVTDGRTDGHIAVAKIVLCIVPVAWVKSVV